MARELQNIIVMGLGYIGLPTASMLATKGHQVLGADVNQKAVDTINSGRIHIVEPDLDILVRSTVNSANLSTSSFFSLGIRPLTIRASERSGACCAEGAIAQNLGQ
jgi:UDP-N-acetyl-D-mannosaminuronate dehydrogenase